MHFRLETKQVSLRISKQKSPMLTRHNQNWNNTVVNQAQISTKGAELKLCFLRYHWLTYFQGSPCSLNVALEYDFATE